METRGLRKIEARVAPSRDPQAIQQDQQVGCGPPRLPDTVSGIPGGGRISGWCIPHDFIPTSIHSSRLTPTPNESVHGDMKTVGYVRVSTYKQADRGVSLEAQAEKIRAMAVVHTAELLDIIVDGGESPKSLTVPVWRGCSPWWTQVRCRRSSSPSSIVKDLCTLLERFERRGVALVSVAESLDTGSAAGRLVLNIMTAVSQWEREAIGERTRDVMSHKQTNGERVGNIQFGYRLCADGKHVEPDAAEQAVLAEIRQMRQDGKTLRGIAAALNGRAYRTRRGSAWRLEHVARIVGKARAR